MLALSTSWISNDYTNGEALLDRIRRFNITGVELEYRITDAMFRQMRTPLRKSGLKVTSLHNYFPLPPTAPRALANGDLFLLSHPDKEERMRAVEWTGRTIETANDLEAPVVVLHCGCVKMDADAGRLQEFYTNGKIESDEAQEFIRILKEDRERNRPKHLEALMLSLDRLASKAARMDVLLGLENRYFFHELPGIDDFEILFREFEGGPLRYWHDTGHARSNELLTLYAQEDLLKANADRLAGMHLHDAKGLDDHLAPGTGELDFEMIKKYLKEDTLKVIELKGGTPDAEVAAGIDFLRSIGID